MGSSPPAIYSRMAKEDWRQMGKQEILCEDGVGAHKERVMVHQEKSENGGQLELGFEG